MNSNKSRDQDLLNDFCKENESNEERTFKQIRLHL